MQNKPRGVVPSGLLSADTAIQARRARFWGLVVLTDGTNAATVTVYDNASAASGTVLFKLAVAGSALTDGALFVVPISATNGIYCDVSGTGANYICYYEPMP